MLYINSSLKFLFAPEAPNTLTCLTKDIHAPEGVSINMDVTVIDDEADVKATGRVIHVTPDGESFTVLIPQNTVRSIHSIEQKHHEQNPTFNIAVSLLLSVSVIGYFMWSGLDGIMNTANYQVSFDSWTETLTTLTPWAFIIAPPLAGMSARYAFKTRLALKQAWFSTFFASASGAIGGLTFTMLAFALTSDYISDTQSSISATPDDISRFTLSIITVIMLIGAAIPAYLAIRKAPTVEYIKRIG